MFGRKLRLLKHHVTVDSSVVKKVSLHYIGRSVIVSNVRIVLLNHMD
jgi:hypothetical protein